MVLLWLCAAGGLTPASASETTWQETLDNVVPSVVSIRVAATRDFDSEDAGNSVGTGFVVDAERGILLTNRHMVHAGPVRAEAVWLNHEEIDLEPIYRDPVHDFGFYRFDPSDLRFMEPKALELAPQAPQVGMEIRVVGNDAGEKISILDGTLARLDRSAPNYGMDTYNDFNTFYMQAASGTSGGSSGSPVIARDGRVVGLNAGGRRDAASSYYLPLDRVVRALERIQRGEEVSRGTLLTTFVAEPYEACRKLGMTASLEESLRERFPDGIGALVVDRTLNGSEAHEHLQPGDILTHVNGELTATFLGLESVLDEKVSEEVSLTVERAGVNLELVLRVSDLHEVSPADYLEMGRGILNDVSYQMARLRSHPLEGVYVAAGGYMLGRAGILEGMVITSVDGEPTLSLDEFQDVMQQKADGQDVIVRAHPIQDPRHDQVFVVKVDRTWFPMRRCARAEDGSWPCEDAMTPPESPERGTEMAFPLEAPDRVSRAVAPALVMVDFDLPYSTAGTRGGNYKGTGVVIDAKQGRVLVDRDTVPVALGDITITVAGSVRVPGTFEYLDPVHNAAVVRFDPAALGETPVGEVSFVESFPEPGQKVWLVGLDRFSQVISHSTNVSRVLPYATTPSGTPQFRQINADRVTLSSSMPTLGGVLVDRRGRVWATWASTYSPSERDRSMAGLPLAFLQGALDGPEVPRCDLGVEWRVVELAGARERGLAEHRAEDVVEAFGAWRRLLEVARLHGGSTAADVLEEGDILIELGQASPAPVARFRQIEDISRGCPDEVSGVVLRDGAEVDVRWTPRSLDVTGVRRIVNWAGLVIHESHNDVAAQQGVEFEGVYVAWQWYGSPASRDGLRPTRHIVQVGDVDTPDLDAFIEAIRGLPDRQSVRVKTVLLDGREEVLAVRLDHTYWPASEISYVEGDWRRADID